MIQETGWRWDEVRAMTFGRLWSLFGYWAKRDGGGRIPPPPSREEIAAAFSRVAWRN